MLESTISFKIEYIITMTKSTENFNSENISFENALIELETIVKKLDLGSQSLDESIKSYERASWLKKYCLKKLDEAKLTIEKITKDTEGNISLEDETDKF